MVPRRDRQPLITPHKPGGVRFVRPPSLPPSSPPRRRGRRFFPLLFLLALAAAATFYAAASRPGPDPVRIAEREGRPVLPVPASFPRQDTLTLRGDRWVTRYSPDEALQTRTVRWLNRYRPQSAVVVVCDLRTGQIRVVAERDSTGTRTSPQLAFGTTYPAASLAKIVTAAAVLENGVHAPRDNLPLIGGAYTLYRNQLRIPTHGRYPTVTLQSAFARSVNPTFGLLGMQLGPEPLHSMAERLGFNRSLEVASGLDPAFSRYVAPDTGFGLAEAASGFTRATTISPLHALQIARAIGRDGRLLPLRFTDGLQTLDGTRMVSLPSMDDETPILSPQALEQLRALMEATVTSGTARRGFQRNMTAQDMRNLQMGGKTGSLTGRDPPGRYEWFVGYAQRRDNPDDGIAVAVMLINRDYLAVHASELAGLVIRDWARHSQPFEDARRDAIAGN